MGDDKELTIRITATGDADNPVVLPRDSFKLGSPARPQRVELQSNGLVLGRNAGLADLFHPGHYEHIGCVTLASADVSEIASGPNAFSGFRGAL
jgi:hypothetical protein